MAAENRARRWWASLGTGAAICLACCLAPLLAALGIAGGGVALLSLSWLEPLGFALVIAGISGLIGTRRRSRARGCGADCGSATSADDPAQATVTGCGCARANAER